MRVLFLIVLLSFAAFVSADPYQSYTTYDDDSSIIDLDQAYTSARLESPVRYGLPYESTRGHNIERSFPLERGLTGLEDARVNVGVGLLQTPIQSLQFQRENMLDSLRHARRNMMMDDEPKMRLESTSRVKSLLPTAMPTLEEYQRAHELFLQAMELLHIPVQEELKSQRTVGDLQTYVKDVRSTMSKQRLARADALKSLKEQHADWLREMNQKGVVVPAELKQAPTEADVDELFNVQGFGWGGFGWGFPGFGFGFGGFPRWGGFGFPGWGFRRWGWW